MSFVVVGVGAGLVVGGTALTSRSNSRAAADQQGLLNRGAGDAAIYNQQARDFVTDSTGLYNPATRAANYERIAGDRADAYGNAGQGAVAMAGADPTATAGQGTGAFEQYRSRVLAGAAQRALAAGRLQGRASAAGILQAHEGQQVNANAVMAGTRRDAAQRLIAASQAAAGRITPNGFGTGVGGAATSIGGSMLGGAFGKATGGAGGGTGTEQMVAVPKYTYTPST